LHLSDGEVNAYRWWASRGRCGRPLGGFLERLAGQLLLWDTRRRR